MTIDGIETFLAIVENESVSAAANKLFISQSSASHRLALLEEELGIPLIIRQKGHKTIDLTSYGLEFVPIAQQWLSLWKDTQAIRGAPGNQTLTIGSIDLVNNYTFLPLYLKHIKQHPEIKLSIRTHHSPEIHGLLQNRTIDIGYVFSQVRSPDIISVPIYREKMYLMVRKDAPYYDDIASENLDPSKEIYLRWGPDYELWHDRYWPDCRPYVTVNTGSMLINYLQEPEHWAVAPISEVRAMQNFHDITYYRLKNPPPPRICYQLTHRYSKPSMTALIQSFSNEISEFISSEENICRYEPWMLQDPTGLR